jgi:hypothetical protein
MRRILLIVAMLLIAAPAMATVTVSAIDKGCGVVEVNYICTGTDRARAFALDIAVDSNFTIVNIKDFNRGESNKVAPGKLGYGIFPGKFRDWINPASPNWADTNYNPVAPVNDLDANTGLRTKAVTVELGTLYVAGNEPCLTGTLFRLDVNENKFGVADCNLRLTLNTTRGGIVDVNGNPVTSVVLATGTGKVKFPDCFPCWQPYKVQYNNWKTVLKPACWCGKTTAKWKYQCDGDADGAASPPPESYRIFTADLTIMSKAWTKPVTHVDFNACADFDHAASAPPDSYRVFTGDLTILVNNWAKTNTALQANCPR